MKKVDDCMTYISNIREKMYNFIIFELEKRGINGLVPSHGSILINLYYNKEMTKSDVAKKIKRKKSTVTVLVNKLIQEGYVEEHENQEDSRSKKISLTKKGKEFIPVLFEISEDMYNEQYVGFEEEEKILLVKLLSKMNGNFSNL